jgi:hypothetical protein
MSPKNATQTLFLGHGDGGGVGKTTVTTLIASILIEWGYHIVVIDADAAETAGKADVHLRFVGKAGADTVTAPILIGNEDAEDTITRLFNLLARFDVAYAVMNAPANASETLDRVGKVFGAIAERQGVDLRVAYSLDRSQALQVADRVASGPFFSSASRAAFVRNEAFGSEERFDKALDNLATAGRFPRVTVGRLSQDSMERLQRDYPDRHYAELIDPVHSPLSVAEQVVLQEWYHASARSLCAALAPELFENPEDPAPMQEGASA